MVGWKEESLSKAPNRAHVFVFLFLRATHTWRKIHCQGRPFQQHVGRDFEILPFLRQNAFLSRSFEYLKWICWQEILNVKSPVPTFLSFPKPISLRPTKMFISSKSGSFSDFEFSLREIFITDGSDSVHALEFYHLFSRGYEAPILRFVLRNLCRQIGPASPACWWQGRLVWLDRSKSLIYTGGHDSYRSV